MNAYLSTFSFGLSSETHLESGYTNICIQSVMGTVIYAYLVIVDERNPYAIANILKRRLSGLKTAESRLNNYQDMLHRIFKGKKLTKAQTTLLSAQPTLARSQYLKPFKRQLRKLPKGMYTDLDTVMASFEKYVYLQEQKHSLQQGGEDPPPSKQPPTLATVAIALGILSGSFLLLAAGLGSAGHHYFIKLPREQQKYKMNAKTNTPEFDSAAYAYIWNVAARNCELALDNLNIACNHNSDDLNNLLSKFKDDNTSSKIDIDAMFDNVLRFYKALQTNPNASCPWYTNMLRVMKTNKCFEIQDVFASINKLTKTSPQDLLEPTKTFSLANDSKDINLDAVITTLNSRYTLKSNPKNLDDIDLPTPISKDSPKLQAAPPKAALNALTTAAIPKTAPATQLSSKAQVVKDDDPEDGSTVTVVPEAPKAPVVPEATAAPKAPVVPEAPAAPKAPAAPAQQVPTTQKAAPETSVVPVAHGVPKAPAAPVAQVVPKAPATENSNAVVDQAEKDFLSSIEPLIDSIVSKYIESNPSYANIKELISVLVKSRKQKPPIKNYSNTENNFGDFEFNVSLYYNITDMNSQIEDIEIDIKYFNNNGLIKKGLNDESKLKETLTDFCKNNYKMYIKNKEVIDYYNDLVKSAQKMDKTKFKTQLDALKKDPRFKKGVLRTFDREEAINSIKVIPPENKKHFDTIYNQLYDVVRSVQTSLNKLYR